MSTLDKYEYKLKVEEIKTLISEKEYLKAMEIADTIDWRRAKSVMMLCTVSDLYKINRKFEESRDILLLAYDRHPGGRLIVYSLCELAIKMGDVISAIEYYKEFVQIAPQDTGRFVLQYRLYEMQEVSLEERIHVLEEFKKREYKEKWAYELAYLYHRVGLATRCVEECDELILWFGDGKYVMKAMELKMLHQPLNQEQHNKYLAKKNPEQKPVEQEVPLQQNQSEANFEIDHEFHVKTVNVGEYDTINLQKELAMSMQELLSQPEISTPAPAKEDVQTEVFYEDKNTRESKALLEEEIRVEEIFMDSNKTLEQVMEEKPLLKDTVTKIQEEQKAKKDGMVELSYSGAMNLEAVQSQLMNAVKSPGFEKMLAQDYDGQITLVVPEAEKVEKQITGQLSIEEVMAEWERMKQENEEKRKQELKQRVLEQTGPLFTDFDLASKQGILAQLDELDVQEDLIEEDLIEEDLIEEDLIKEDEIEEITEDSSEEGAEDISEDFAAYDDTEEIISEQESIDMEMTEEKEYLLEDSLEDSLEDTLEEQEEDVKQDGDILNEDVIVEATRISLAKARRDNHVPKLRHFTSEEKRLFQPFAQTKEAKRQILDAIEKISLAAFTGNVVLTGDQGAGTVDLAKNLIKMLQMTDENFSGKVAKITGEQLNAKDFKSVVEKLNNGALIIEQAGLLSKKTQDQMAATLNHDKHGIVVIMEDTISEMCKLLTASPALTEFFNARIDVAELSSDALIRYAKDYAKEREYSIDEFGVLALYNRIDDMQTNCHAVTIPEVKELVDEAIEHTNRFQVGHFLDVLLGKRYDKEDMIILREKDFFQD